MKEMIDYLNYLTEEDKNELVKSLSLPSKKGLVLNTRRASKDVLKGYNLTQDEYDDSLFIYSSEDEKMGKNVLHEAGAYYILDPSACLISKNLISERKEIVLDMCAAPGGKTISYALKNPQSLIIANDRSYKRATELSKNVERLGLANVVVTSYEPSYFLKDFEDFFSVIILDAPCSGSGMFRKDENVKEDWSYEKVLSLLPVQDELLEVAYKLLKKGGVLSYSTCSFLEEEDEERVRKLIDNHPDMTPIDLKHEEGFYYGTINKTVHLLPSHYKNGEGHYIALLRKEGEFKENKFTSNKYRFDKDLSLYTVKYKNEEYALNEINDKLFKLDSLRFGLKLTNKDKYSKLDIDHAKSHYLTKIDIELDLEQAKKYLKGEELSIKTSKNGIVVLGYLGVSLGFGKASDNKVKNYYPKGLRKSL